MSRRDEPFLVDADCGCLTTSDRTVVTDDAVLCPDCAAGEAPEEGDTVEHVLTGRHYTVENVGPMEVVLSGPAVRGTEAVDRDLFREGAWQIEEEPREAAL